MIKLSDHLPLRPTDTVEFSRSTIKMSLDKNCAGCYRFIRPYSNITVVSYKFPPIGSYLGIEPIIFYYHLKCYESIFESMKMEEFL